MAYSIDFIKNAAAPVIGTAYANDGHSKVVVQMGGTFTSASAALEGRTVAGEGAWLVIDVLPVNDKGNPVSEMTGKTVYEGDITNYAEIRFNLTAVSGGLVSLSGVFYDAGEGGDTPYIPGDPTAMAMGGSNLFVKGVAEQIFIDPDTGNIVGYDKTATNAAVATQINLQEVVGGMGNRLVGVLPDSVRVNGTYESAAFSLETREKIMGGTLAYDARAPICEEIEAEGDTLTVSEKPAPYYGEEVETAIGDKTVTAPVVSIDDFEPSARFFKGIETAVKATQEGSGDPSPENIRPITGWTGAKIRRTGKNLWGGDAVLDDVKDAIPSATVDAAARTVRFSSKAPASYAILGYSSSTKVHRFRFKENTRYTFILALQKTAGLGTNLIVRYTDGSTVQIPPLSASGVKETKVFVTAARKTVQYLGKNNSSGYTDFYADECGLFEGVLRAEDFEPYAGTEVSVDWESAAGEVYGGKLNVLTGELTVTHKKYSFTTIDGTGGASAKPYAFVNIPNADKVLVEPYDEMFSNMLSHWTGANSAMPANFGKIIYSSVGSTSRLIFRMDVSEQTKAGYDAKLATLSSPVEFVVKLANPVTYQLTPAQISPLVGVNNIWSNTGDISVTYLSGEEVELPGDYHCYVREKGQSEWVGTNYSVNSDTRVVNGFLAEPGKTYEVMYYTHKASVSALPIPSVWNPVVMTVQVKYGVYAKQGRGNTTNQGVLKGWLYFIVPRAMLTADAGVNASQTGTATTDGSWMALTNKPENLPMCGDCGGNSSPMAYYVFVPCSGSGDSVVDLVAVGGGLALGVGQKAQLPLKLLMPDDTLVQPDFATLGYLSDNEAVAAVNDTGVVTAVGAGETIVRAYYAKDDGTVLDAEIPVVVS